MLNCEAKNCFRKIVKFHNKDELQSLEEFTQLINLSSETERKSLFCKCF